MDRYLCIHCHFYQPPRENPWLEAVELQDSAYPCHDWNERITAECYAANSASRILGLDGRIVRIVNNYAHISFNFGPTLLSWLEENAPEVYGKILDADRQSRQRFSGHGSALAQAYNHLILPLSNPEDKFTQVLWGIHDFRHRFGRDPERLKKIEAVVALARSLPFEVDLWQVQNIYYELRQSVYRELLAQSDEKARAWVESFHSLGRQLGMAEAEPQVAAELQAA
jgi:alpha-amylase/alpha-mannosidase (GH57 family)